MTRLFLRVYASFLGIVLLFFALSALLFWSQHDPRERALLYGGGTVLGWALPPQGAPEEALEDRVAELSAALGAGVAVFDDRGHRLAEAGPFVPRPDPERSASHVARRHGEAVVSLRLADGRWLAVAERRGRHGPPGGLLALGLLAALIALFSWPLARGIAGRVERLAARVDRFGAGDLAARAPVEGRDEVARLAERFNRAAERIEALVAAQRTLLAGASHELRSPLARVRVAAELLAGADTLAPARREELRAGLGRDVEQLDAAVEELLMASRLDLLDAAADEPVDLLALAAEEGARFGVEAGGAAASVAGDAAALRHLVRNLLNNAARHGGGVAALEVTPLPDGGGRLVVEDGGPGPPADPEALFAPFAKGAPGGAGLGLAIARRVARHHGGELRFEARPGGGSRLVATLPGRPPPAPSASDARPEESP